MPVVDMATWSREDLMRLAAASCPDPLRDMLDTQPGVLPERQAYLTGALYRSDRDVGLVARSRGSISERFAETSCLMWLSRHQAMP